MRWTITIVTWVVLSIGILAITTIRPPTVKWSTGGFTSGELYGWPDAWLSKSAYDTTQWINGEKIPGQRTVTWGVEGHKEFAVAIACSTGIAACGILPLVLAGWVMTKRKQKGQQGDTSNLH